MTPDEIKAARALIVAATPPPWGAKGDSVVCPSDEERDRRIEAGEPVHCCVVAYCDNEDHLTPTQAAANAAFIAAARTLLPDALDEIERLRSLVEAAYTEGFYAYDLCEREADQAWRDSEARKQLDPDAPTKGEA